MLPQSPPAAALGFVLYALCLCSAFATPVHFPGRKNVEFATPGRFSGRNDIDSAYDFIIVGGKTFEYCD